NEEVYLLRHIGAAVNARVAGISWSPPGAFHDDFLVKADKNPNTQGLRLQGLAPDGAVGELVAAAGEGTLRTLVLHPADLVAWRDAAAARAALERVPYPVVLDTDFRATAQYANVVLPIGTYAESGGPTLTSPRADAHNHWFDASHRSTASLRSGAARRPDRALRPR